MRCSVCGHESPHGSSFCLNCGSALAPAVVQTPPSAGGLPVICTHVAGCAAELVQSNGRLVEPGSVTELRQAMMEIGMDPTLRDGMAAQSEVMIALFSPEAWASGIVEAAQAVG